MQKRKLGRSDLEFSPIAFGGNVFGWTADEATSHRFYENNRRRFTTAALYEVDHILIGARRDDGREDESTCAAHPPRLHLSGSRFIPPRSFGGASRDRAADGEDVRLR